MLFIVVALTDIPPPDISIIREDVPVVGQMFMLLCRVIVADVVATEPQVTWLSPEGNTLSSEEEVTVGTQPVIGNPSKLTTYILQFSPLMTSHAGTYTCQVTLTSPYGTLPVTAERAENVSISSQS